jgi:hypothetical protein
VLESLFDEIIGQIEAVSKSRYQLLLVVAPPGAGKTSALQQVANRSGSPYLNLNLELSRLLLDTTRLQRILELKRLVIKLVRRVAATVVLVDSIELLFEPSLKCDPLALFKDISRNTTLVVAWNGKLQEDQLVYAAPGHPEYRTFAVSDFSVIDLSDFPTRPEPSSVQG